MPDHSLDDLSGRIIANRSLTKSGHFLLPHSTTTVQRTQLTVYQPAVVKPRRAQWSAIWYQTAATTLPSLRFAVVTDLNSTSSAASRSISPGMPSSLCRQCGNCNGGSGHSCARASYGSIDGQALLSGANRRRVFTCRIDGGPDPGAFTHHGTLLHVELPTSHLPDRVSSMAASQSGASGTTHFSAHGVNRAGFTWITAPRSTIRQTSPFVAQQ